MRALWNNTVIAESDDTVVVEGNHYFPVDSLRRKYFRDSAHSSMCPWKGTASYLDVVVGDEINPNAAWFYRTPSAAAEQIKDRVAFWRGVQIE